MLPDGRWRLRGPPWLRGLGARVDELNLVIEPIVLGGGKRIFPEIGIAWRLQLVKCVTADKGVQIYIYRSAS